MTAREAVVEFDDVQKTLAPVFAGKVIKIIFQDDGAKIIEEKPRQKTLKAKGIFSDYANTEMISGEKGAWERAVVERYAEDNS